MLYPLIYTRTKFHDYRVVTSKSLGGLPHSMVQIFTEVARTMIDAENDQLGEPSWALVKKNGYILWGMSILNDALGENNKDKYNRPVRGFFGFVSDSPISKLPYSISYFKEIYKTYVMPIWDSPVQTEQISCQLPAISGDEFITKSTRLNSDINVELGTCRIFPNSSDPKGLTEAVFASFEDCSIATNIHKKNRCIEFGRDKLSFMNVVGASDSGIRDKQDIKVYVSEEPVIITGDTVKEDLKPFEIATRPQYGAPVTDGETLCPDSKKMQQNKKNLKYGLYGFIVIVGFVLILKGPNIWEAILSSQHSYEITISDDDSLSYEGSIDYKSTPFLTTKKSEFHIQDAKIKDIFSVQYQSSSMIKKVETSDGWIHISPRQQYALSGTIDFVCDSIPSGSRKGAIKIINEEGKNIIITIYQTITHEPKLGDITKKVDTQRRNTTTSIVPKGRLNDGTSSEPSSIIEEIENIEAETSADEID